MYDFISFISLKDLQNFLVINKNTYNLSLGKSLLVNCESNINVVLQLLLHIKELKLLDGDTLLIKSFKQLYKKTNEGNFIVSPKTFMSNISFHPTAESFMDYLLDHFHENGNTFNNDIEFVNNKNIMFQSSKLGKPSLILDIFYGQFMLHYICIECENSFYDFVTFKYLNADFNTQLRYDYTYKCCKKCGEDSKDSEHSLITYIYKLPKILTLKNDNSISELKIYIDLYKFSMEYKTVYKLKSIICKTKINDYYIIIFTGIGWSLFKGGNVYNFDISTVKLDEIILLTYTNNIYEK